MKVRALLLATASVTALGLGVATADVATATSTCTPPSVYLPLNTYLRRSLAYSNCLLVQLRSSYPSYAPSSGGYATSPSRIPGGGSCAGASCYGAPSTSSGLPRTTYVPGYYRGDGTYVGGYYTSH